MKKADRILLVDDESYTLDFLSYNLKSNGFEVFTSTNGEDALSLAKTLNPGIILLDIMMPGMDGIETCYELRKINSLKYTCIAFLTARGEDYTQIAGFEAGADDFITKPIRLNVLLPRLKAHLKRIARSHDGKILEVGDMQILIDKYTVRQGDKSIRLSRKEFSLLCLFANNPNKVYTLKEVFSLIWGRDSPVMDRTVNVHISRLRKKLDRELIVTAGGSGYRLK